MLSADEPFSFFTYDGGSFRYSIHAAGYSHGKHFGPLLYGKEYILQALHVQPFFEIDFGISAYRGSHQPAPQSKCWKVLELVNLRFRAGFKPTSQLAHIGFWLG